MLKMYWFLLIFILKVLPIIQAAPIDIAADAETLENIIHQGFMVTDNVNNLAKVTMKDSQKLSNNNNAEATTILVRVDETAEEFLQRKTKPILNNADSAVKEAVDTFTEGLKSLKNFSFNKNSQDVQNSNINENEQTHTSPNFDQTSVESVGSEFLESVGFNQNSAQDPNINENIETTTTNLGNLGQTAEESSEFKQTLDTINSTVQKSVDTFNDGLKDLNNFSFNKNSAEIENVETTSPNLDKTSEDSAESKHVVDTLNSALQHTADSFNDGLKSLENLSFHQNSADSQNANINENVDTSTNQGQIAETSLESQQTLDTINSAFQESVDALNEGSKSLENLSFHENSSDFQNPNINENLETTTSANLGQTAEKSLESQQTLDAINSAVQQSVDTLNEGFKSLENLSLKENSSDSQNFNFNKNDETTASAILGQTTEESLESKQILGTINSVVQKSVDTFTDGLKSLENLRFYQNSSDSKNVSLNENGETTTATLANLNQTSQKSLDSKQILAIPNSEVKESVNAFTEGLNILENLGFQQNSTDFQDFNSKENIETTTTVNLNQFPEESEVLKTLETINSAVNETVDNFNAGLKSLDNFSFQQNSADFPNLNINENVETTLANLDQTPEGSSEYSQIKANIKSAVEDSVNTISEGLKSFANLSFQENSTASQNWNSNKSAETTTTLENLNQTHEESAELKQTLDAINSPVYKSVNTFTEGLRSLDNLSFQQNSEDSQNFNINENEQTTTISVNLNNTSGEPTTLETNNSVVKESVDPFNEGLKSLENLNYQQNAEDFPNLKKLLQNINSAAEESVDTLNEGFRSLENFGFQHNYADSQKSNINKNIETTSANLDNTPKKGNESKILESINSEIQQSVNTFSEGVHALNNFGLNQNSKESENLSPTETGEKTTPANLHQNPTTLETVNSGVKQSAEAVVEGLNALKNIDVNGSSTDSHKSNIDENVETTTTSANMEQNHEENSETKTLETINLAPTHYNNIFNEGLISLKNFDIIQPQQNSQNSNNIVNVELATISLNPDLSAEESSISEIIETINSTQKQSEEIIDQGLKTLENFTFHQNSADSQNSNIYENDETAATTISVDRTQAPIENLESNSFSEGLNALKNYKNSETFRNGVATTNSVNLEEKYTETSEPNLFETINSEVKHSVETVNEGLNSLGSFGVSNYENSNNSNNSEVEKTTTSSSNLENKILDSKILKTLDSAVKESVDTANDGLIALNNFSLKKNSEDSQNLENNVEQISKESFEFKSNSENSQNLNNKSTLNNSIDSLNTTVSAFVDNFNQGLNKLENFSLNTNSEHFNTHVETAKDLDSVDQKPEMKETSDYINSEFKQSAGIFNESVKVLDNFTNLENGTTDSNSSLEEVEVAKVKEIFITTQSPIVNLFERFNKIPVNEYLLKQNEEPQENLTHNFEQTSENNSGLTQLSVTSTREKEQNLSENYEEIKNEPLAPLDIPPTQKEINIEKILSPTEISIVNLKESTDQTSEKIHDQTTALNSAVDLLNNGVILMKNYLNLDNSPVKKTTEILKTTEAPVLNLFESLCLVPKDVPVSNNTENVTPAYEELKHNVEKILNRAVEEKSSESGDYIEEIPADPTSTDKTKKIVNEMKKILTSTEAPILNLFESLCLVPKDIPKSNTNNNENITPAYEELKHNVEEILNKNSQFGQAVVSSTEGKSLESGDYIEEIKNEPLAPLDIPLIQKEINMENILSATEISIVNLKESTDPTTEEIHDQTTALNSAVDLLNNGVILMKNYLNLDNSRVKETTDSSFEEILKTTEAPVLNLFESLCLVPKDVPVSNNNENVTPAYEELKHNVEKILNRAVEGKSSESGDYIEEIPADPTSTEKTKKIVNEMRKILTSTEAPILNLFESLCLVPKDIPKSNTNNNENITPAYEELKHNVEEILNKNSEFGQAVVSSTEEKSLESGDYIEKIPADEDKMSNQTTTEETIKVTDESSERIPDVGHNIDSVKVAEIFAAKSLNENINRNLEDSQLSYNNNNENVEQTEKLVEQLISVNVKEEIEKEGEKMENIFITSQMPTDSKHSNTVVNEKVSEPEVGQDILQIAAKLIQEDDRIMDLNKHVQTTNFGHQNEEIVRNEFENIQTKVANSQTSTESENSKANNENFEQNYGNILVVKNVDDFKTERNENQENMQPLVEVVSRNVEEGHTVESQLEVVTEMPITSNEKLPNLAETIREVNEETLTTTQKSNDLEAPKSDNLTADNESQEVNEDFLIKFNTPTELSAAGIKTDDSTISGTETKIKDSTRNQESETRSNLPLNNQMEATTFASTQPETIRNSSQFTTNPSINTEETTLNMPAKFEEELNMAVKTLEATTHQHFEQFQQNLKKAFKSFTEWESEHMKQEETTPSDDMITATGSLQEDNNTTEETTLQQSTHKLNEEYTTTMERIEQATPETTPETSSTEVPAEIPNLGVINEIFVDKYQENVQENSQITEASATMPTLTKVEEEYFTSAPLIALNTEIINIPVTTMIPIEALTKLEADSSTSAQLILPNSEHIPETTMTPNVLTTMKTTSEENKGSQEEIAQQRTVERTASAEMTTFKNDMSEDHSTAVASDHYETVTETQITTTESDGETTIVPLFARVQLQRDINSVSLVSYDNDYSEKEIVKENFENTNAAAVNNNKTTQQQSNEEYIEQVHEVNDNNNDKTTTQNPSEETPQFIKKEEEMVQLSTPETFLQDMVTFIHNQNTTPFKPDEQSSQTQLPLTQASFMEEQQQQIESTTETNPQTQTTATGVHDLKTKIETEITTTINESITPTTEPEVYSTFIVEAETETTNTTPSPIQIEPENRSRALPPPKLEYLQNEDGVEVFYGYSIVKRN